MANNNNNVQPDIKNEGKDKKTTFDKTYKEKNTNDNKKVDKIEEVPEDKSKWL